MFNSARRLLMACVTVALGLVIGAAESRAGSVVYATASNETNNVFGTLNLATGQFTQIATTTPQFNSLTTGPGPTLYGGASDGNLYTISPAGVTSLFGTVSSPGGANPGFWGLASEGATGFFADELKDGGNGSFDVPLVHISADGKSLSSVGAGVSNTFAATGNLTFGPDGKLYLETSKGTNFTAYLFSVNTTTGALTALSSALVSVKGDFLTLASSGSTLYGIDTVAGSSQAIYTINTTTGAASKIGTVSGLSGYSVDTISDPFFASVPEPSSLSLFVTGSLVVLGLWCCGHRGSPRRS